MPEEAGIGWGGEQPGPDGEGWRPPRMPDVPAGGRAILLLGDDQEKGTELFLTNQDDRVDSMAKSRAISGSSADPGVAGSPSWSITILDRLIV